MGNKAEILASKRKEHAMAKNTICLWYDKDAEAAARFYSDTFPDSVVSAVHRAPSAYPAGKKGDVLTVEFTVARSEEHTSELQSLMRILYAVFGLKKKTNIYN